MPTLPPRRSGLLLHITSLPSSYGVGDLGPAAFAFADVLARTHQRLWQMLPLGPIGYGHLPLLQSVDVCWQPAADLAGAAC